MKVIPQYKVIGSYNYDRIIHNIENNYVKRQDIGQTNGKVHLIECEASCQLPVLLLVIYTLILNIY